jgi:membrane associated rhomboid family serine protease
MYMLIGANVVVFILWQNDHLRHFLMKHFAVSTYGVLSDLRLHTLFTSVFSNPNFGSLLGNVVTLWFFGAECLAMLGTKRFLQLYVLGGLASGAVSVLWPLLAPSLHRLNVHSLNFPATGAVNAVVMYSILAFPQRTVYLYMFLPVPASWLGGLFIAKDAYALTTGDRSFGSAGNLAGTAYGIVCWYAWRRRWRF